MAEALQDGEDVTLDLEGGRVVSARGTLALPRPPDFVRQIWDAGGVSPLLQEIRPLPGGSVTCAGASAVARKRTREWDAVTN